MVMEEDLSHLDTDRRPHARMGVDDRLLWIKQDRWINYVRAERVLDRLAELLSYRARAHAFSLAVCRPGHGQNSHP
jgi:Bacterial TniB protein